MIDSFVDVRVKLDGFEKLAHRVASLPPPFRPKYFSVGERVRDKSKSLIEDGERFGGFVAERVGKVSGFDLLGEWIRYGFFVGETRTAAHTSTHIGCSVILRGAQWCAGDLLALLKLLCRAHGVERAEACRREEWEFRHKCVKQVTGFTIERTLGTDMSAALPSLYWWTVFSEELAARHRLDIAGLAAFAKSSERWMVDDGRVLHAFKLYDGPDDWLKAKESVTRFLESRTNFFSLTRLAHEIEAAKTKDDFDATTKPYVAGARPWESLYP